MEQEIYGDRGYDETPDKPCKVDDKEMEYYKQVMDEKYEI